MSLTICSRSAKVFATIRRGSAFIDPRMHLAHGSGARAGAADYTMLTQGAGETDQGRTSTSSATANTCCGRYRSGRQIWGCGWCRSHLLKIRDRLETTLPINQGRSFLRAAAMTGRQFLTTEMMHEGAHCTRPAAQIAACLGSWPAPLLSRYKLRKRWSLVLDDRYEFVSFRVQCGRQLFWRQLFHDFLCLSRVLAIVRFYAALRLAPVLLDERG